jgi:ATP-binding cassette, subfamily G (WHITE), member 2, SNQ2
VPAPITNVIIMATFSSGTSTPVDVENRREEIRKRLTVTFRDLNVRVTAPDAALGSTLWSEVDPRQLVGFFRRNQRPKRVRFDRSDVEVILSN